MKKLVFVSNIAAPYQVKFCYSLQKFFDTEFWFYDHLGTRPKFWEIPLGNKCKIIKNVFFKRQERYLTFEVFKMLNKFQPDYIIIGGFTIPSNYLIYLWGKFYKRKVIVFTERSRDKNGNLRKNGIIWRCIRHLYKDIDMILVSDKDIVAQFRDEFGFGNKVTSSQYPCDIDNYLDHELRKKKESYTFIFPNRLIDIYNPIGTIKIFHDILLLYPKSKLLLNGHGDLREKCQELIEKFNINQSVLFLDNISSWDDLNLYYKQSDILLLPAKFSNGNFTIIESMASGLGIIISKNILGVGKLIEDNVNGFNCEDSHQEYINAIMNYINNPDLFTKHGLDNKARVKDLSISSAANLFFDQLSTL